MSEYHWLKSMDIEFPDPNEADSEGIVAIGGDLSIPTLLSAYRIGIFPWFNENQPILWWSPDPRFVLFPKELKIAKSMRSYFNQKKFKITFDHAFQSVINACQEIRRKGQLPGTWITEDMKRAYIQLHNAGYAHSVEVWDDEDLVGGLYGVAIGKVFFGESMFSLKSNASKMGFIQLVKTLRSRGYKIIDCQQETRHLQSLGARSIPRKIFLDRIKKLTMYPTDNESWSSWSEETDA
ncbi:MAG: leucyl/phenylalanyl-tRNA--protein transferase [Bacteroidia bacterium]|nr:leucyl/phenylalanyl-tRNA--protein transferase [Bacteroidia bacterium]